MTNTPKSCWLHPKEPVADCPTCPAPTHTCIEHGPFYGATTECPHCLHKMERHKTRARNALVGMLREIKKAREPLPNLMYCATARGEQMREIIQALGLKIEVMTVDNFPWEKFQLLRK